MVQDQLVEYISSQTKAGVSPDTIKSTLVGAGWQAVDVDDTLKKVAATSGGQPITSSPASSTSAASTAAFMASSKPASAPQTIKMSDLISNSDSASSSSSMSGSKPASPIDLKPGATSFSAKDMTAKSPSSHGALITEIVLGVLIIAIGALAGYLYSENGSLNSKITGLEGQTTSVSSQVTALNAAINASTTNWTSQIAMLTTNNQELQTELSFFAAPSDASSSATSTATLSGSLSGGGKVPYVITAQYGAKVYVSNSKDAAVITVLQPLEASSTTASFTGIYLPGADSMTLTAVNGTAVQ